MFAGCYGSAKLTENWKFLDIRYNYYLLNIILLWNVKINQQLFMLIEN